MQLIQKIAISKHKQDFAWNIHANIVALNYWFNMQNMQCVDNLASKQKVRCLQDKDAHILSYHEISDH
jgi:hypothetical protein